MTRQQPEPIDALLEGLAVYQVIVRALLHEFVRRSAEGPRTMKPQSAAPSMTCT